MVSGMCLKGVWRVSGRLLEAFRVNLKFYLNMSIEYSNLGFYYNQNENFYLELECGPAQSYLLQYLCLNKEYFAIMPILITYLRGS